MGRIRAGERREALVAAATMLIAECGVGGLRTREVAARVGITHASLHYHFPTKNELIRAVLEDALGKRVVLPMVTRTTDLPAAERLSRLLGGLARQARQEPTHVVVLKELHHHADRDEAARLLLEPYFLRWRGFLVDLITTAQADGDFDPQLDPEATASVLMLLILGVRLGGQFAPGLDRSVIGQVMHMLGSLRRSS